MSKVGDALPEGTPFEKSTAVLRALSAKLPGSVDSIVARPSPCPKRSVEEESSHVGPPSKRPRMTMQEPCEDRDHDPPVQPGELPQQTVDVVPRPPGIVVDGIPAIEADGEGLSNSALACAWSIALNPEMRLSDLQKLLRNLVFAAVPPTGTGGPPERTMQYSVLKKPFGPCEQVLRQIAGSEGNIMDGAQTVVLSNYKLMEWHDMTGHVTASSQDDDRSFTIPEGVERDASIPPGQDPADEERADPPLVRSML